MTVTIAQSWIAEGRAEGIAEGKAEGKVESLVLFLASRFGEVPASVQKKLMGLQDIHRLEKMIKLAATCGSLKEFQKAL